jgi:hypothetical protein
LTVFEVGALLDLIGLLEGKETALRVRLNAVVEELVAFSLYVVLVAPLGCFIPKFWPEAEGHEGILV